ncbi:MAG: putative cytokinetic ring protein SteA [Corynebacterium sp.]|nr:putative cytokinetic ring protein SteA [Corynebacterium sp.]
MGCMSLFSRNSDLPGIIGVIRDCTSNGKGFKRLSSGDIAVVDAPDMSRALAQRLIAARPAAVVNVSRFTTGAYPNFGPQMLTDEDILLVEGVGAQIWDQLRDGKKARITDDGQLFHGDKLIASGVVISAADAEESFVEAQQELLDHMEAFFGNTIQFIHSESPLLIDGLGVPDVGIELADRKVVVVNPTQGHRNQLKELRNFIREFSPVLIGCDEGADTLVELGYKPDLIVGNPAGIGADALRSGAQVVLPAEPDGHAAGLERIQDLGVGAMTFPAASDSAADLALLLADYHRASMVVSVGTPLDLMSIFSGTEPATPSALLTRTKLGPKLVDASAITELYTVRSGVNIAWVWAALATLVLVAVVLLIAGTSGDGSFTENLINTWNNIALTVQGWFK